MLRWLLALISLHFLLGLGASAWAHTAHAVPGARAALSAAPLVQQCAAQVDGAQPHAVDEGSPGTADGSGGNSVDLPDDQEFQRFLPAGLAAAFTCPRLAAPLLASPLPPPRRRPPRA